MPRTRERKAINLIKNQLWIECETPLISRERTSTWDTLDSKTVYKNQFLVVIEFQANYFNCLLISIYCPPRGNLTQQLTTLQLWIEKYPNHWILLLGDFNAKSRVWGKRDTVERHLKRGGSNKIGFYCPASMHATFFDNGTVDVSFLSTHIGHSCEVVTHKV
ncbi:hypothetical protein CDAR_495151 [Caerostris darwini]|uniref:Endonuclease/exonuclease/phosphatase domain-containing protein n=1 Tax=Caerostris darwini TaxID=1538125 RepID=A0AAV4UXE6_9ARAC|nr:hypothetical protein CDAR_495151 [Caerostris darwini]